MDSRNEMVRQVGLPEITAVDLLVYHIHCMIEDGIEDDVGMTEYLREKGKLVGAVVIYDGGHVVEVQYNGVHYSVMLEDIDLLVETVKYKFELARTGEIYEEKD